MRQCSLLLSCGGLVTLGLSLSSELFLLLAHDEEQRVEEGRGEGQEVRRIEWVE